MMMALVSNVENLPPQVIRKVTKEVMELAESPPEGIKVFVSDEDITDIQATIEGPAGTPFEGGMFKMKLVLGKDFPAAPPQGFFLTKIFHPNVAKNGAICVNTLKRDWKPDNGIKHILLTIKCLLIYPNPESALNEEAGKLLLEHYDDYSSRAKMMTEIHAKPSRSSRTEPELPAGSHSGTSGVLGDTTAGKKRPIDKSSASGSSSGVEKKKKDKKKALKRL